MDMDYRVRQNKVAPNINYSFLSTLHICTETGVDSSSRFPFTCRVRTDTYTNRQTYRRQTHLNSLTTPRYGQSGQFKDAPFLGVATGWIGVNMSTPLCPEAVPETDADLLQLR